jgi:WbqC-like protein family
MRVVISQSMLFPWVGLLEQLRLADVFVHYDDVQFSKGSFVNRVQVKTPEGVRWMTVPTQGLRLGQAIRDVALAPAAAWRDRHLALLRRSFEGAPYGHDALELAAAVYRDTHENLASLARASTIALARYFGLLDGRRLVDVETLGIGGSGSPRVLDVVRALQGTVYVTGHGASRYLDHDAFARAGVAVQYMQYERTPYPQLHGAFTPYVSGLDLVANCGPAGRQHIHSGTVGWEEFVHEST